MNNPVAQLFATTYASRPAQTVSFQLLGPVRAWHGDEEIDLGTPQQRAVLAVLLLADGAPVQVDDVIERVWGENPPRSARGILRTYIYRLRRVLEAASPESDLIEFVAGSYRIKSTGYDLDARKFTDLVRQAEDVKRFDASSARESLRSALSLWKGIALQGCEADWIMSRRDGLESRRIDAMIALFPLELSGGEPGGLLTELGDLWRGQQTHEKLAELYMTGLTQKNQRSSALAVYDEVRHVLQTELGIDPSPELQALHLQILRADGSDERVDAAAPAELTPASLSWRSPAELPHDGSPFVGRDGELAAMVASLTEPNARSIGIAGLDGMGKTRLAVRVAHTVKKNFPDGQIFVNLDDRPVGSVLEELLVTVGMSPTDVPDRVAQRAAAWRTLTSDRSLLLVLDDAAPNRELSMLFPSCPRSAVIITSQRRVLNLPSVHWTRLGSFSTQNSLELMKVLAGEGRVDSEEETARRVAEECSNIPLAVEVAAARLNDRPHWSIEEIEQQLLEDLQSPVVMQEDCLIVDAPLARAESLIEPAALSLYHRLAVAAEDEFTPAWVADELSVEISQATRLLEVLVDVNLLVSLPGRRYGFLSLVRAYSRRQALGAVAG
jgi:DNA-binding SARP family transcriptional activator